MRNARSLINFERLVKGLWEEGEIKTPIHLPSGNATKLVKVFKEIGEEDYVFATHRNMYHALLKGVSKSSLVQAYRQSFAGPLGPYCGSMCVTAREHNFFSTGIVGGGTAIAVGTAWALKEQESPNKVWCFVGDGAADTGHFWEALRYAECQDLPITFVVEDNNRSVCSSIDDRWGTNDLKQRLESSTKVLYYEYTPEYPHVGSGKFVYF